MVGDTEGSVGRVRNTASVPRQFLNFEFYNYESSFKLPLSRGNPRNIILQLRFSDWPNRDPKGRGGEGEKGAWKAQISARKLLF